MMTDSTQLLQPIMSFLHKYTPFQSMSFRHQEYLAMHLDTVFYAEKEIILLPDEGDVDCLYLVKNGLVQAISVTDQRRHHFQYFQIGDSFPVPALLEKRAVNSHYQAVQSTLCYRLNYSHFEYLMQQSVVFNQLMLSHLG
jgi:CBS domain-containing protein